MEKRIIQSVDFYNKWFMGFAPKAYRETRLSTAIRVEQTLVASSNLREVSPELLRNHPEVLSILRMSTCPPIARDRLSGLANVPKSFIASMEDISNPRIPTRTSEDIIESNLLRICNIIDKMRDQDIFIWLNDSFSAKDIDIARAATVVADRLCNHISDPIIRNAQEKRQLNSIGSWLQSKKYALAEGVQFNEMAPGSYSFRSNLPVSISNKRNKKKINISIDVIIMPFDAEKGDIPVLIEAKSAGDFTNVNKRRKEEAHKMTQLKYAYGKNIRYGLFLCGYFDSGYLGYEAAEGIDWVWEHRIDELALFGL